MICSFSFMTREIDTAFYYEIWNEIQKLKWYFYKFAGANADEAIQRTLMHTLTHFQPSKGNLSAYLKKLAREITKECGKLVFVDFLDQTLADDDEEPTPVVDAGRVSDFSTELLDKMEREQDKYGEVIMLALSFMDKFMLLCEALKKHDTSTKYYPEIFIKQCLDISKRCNNFNDICLDIYLEYADDFTWFLELPNDNVGVWKEADYHMIKGNTSKRIRLVDKRTGRDVQDADTTEWSIIGRINEGATKKRIFKVRYYEVWEMMCDMVDSFESNAMKFIIGNDYIIRTLGGSVSVLNPVLYNTYDLVRDEIITNILFDTGGRLLNVGSECVYILVNEGTEIYKDLRVICGNPIQFEYEDITSTVV